MELKQSRLGIKHLRYALAVADAGGFRAASEMLNIAQPAISKSVRDTELDLGIQLFERGPKAVVITAPGRQFLEDARQAVAQFERTIRSSRRNEIGRHGHIVVGYSALASSAQISEGLSMFDDVYPGVQVEMHVMSTDSIMHSLKTGSIDLGFLLSHDSVGDSSIAQVQIWNSNIGLVMPRNAVPLSFDAARTARYVMGVRENWRSFRTLLDEAFAVSDITPLVVEEAWDIHVIFQRVAAGRGYTFYPMSAAQSLPATLQIHPLPGLDARLTIAMAWSAVADTSLLRTFRAQFQSDELLG